jgi:hypothetical protein
MKTTTDAAFTIGSSHQVCQDYALAKEDKVVLCDGCSSSPNTDIGARILAHCGEDLKILRTTLNLLELPEESLDATYLFVKDFLEKIKIRVVGDGVICIKYKDNSYEVTDYIYPSGAPDYVSYQLNTDRVLKFLEVNKGNEPYTEIYSSESDLSKVEPMRSDRIFGNGVELDINTEIDHIEWVALMSDGVHSFTKKDENVKKESIDFLEVLPKLLDFKNFTGKFVQRRMNAFKKFCTKEGWDHYDDLSLAVMHFKDEG